MFQIRNAARMFFFTQPVNLHKGFDRLTVIVQTEMNLDITEETYVLFCNRKKNRVKVLYRDGNNLAIWCKRLSGSLVFKSDEKILMLDQNDFVEFLNNTRSRDRCKWLKKP